MTAGVDDMEQAPVPPAAVEPERYIVRRIRLAHCSRGPERCEQCRRMNVEKLSLLDIAPPHPGEMQRRSIAVRRGGVQVWREFDVVRTFVSEDEARQYAVEYGIEDVEV